MGYASIEIRQSDDPGMTFVPNTFIDRYMAKAPGEYVKVYLYLLRCLYDKEGSFSFAQVAQLFDSSEGDIRRALLFWEDAQLLVLERSGSTITGICICDAPPAAVPQAAGNADDSSSPAPVPDYTPAAIRAFTEDPEILQVIFVAEQYLNRRLHHRELCYFCYWSRQLHFSADLMIDLVDQCVSSGITDIAQLHDCALAWHAADVRSSQDARSCMKQHLEEKSRAAEDTRLQEAVCRAFGIAGRKLNDAECAQIAKWSREWHFSAELICEACRRSVANTHRSSFEYADTVLRNWHSANISDSEGVRAYDDAFRSRRTASSRTHTAQSGTSAGKGTAHSGKYSELERLMLNNA